jgi:hypothetical protein
MQQMLDAGVVTTAHVDQAMYGMFFHDPTFAMRPSPLTYDNFQTNSSDNTAWGSMNIPGIDDTMNYFQQNEEFMQTIMKSSQILPASEETVLGQLLNLCFFSTSGSMTAAALLG